MKTVLVLLAAGLVGAAGTLVAGEGNESERTCARLVSYQTCDFSRFERCYLISLGHENDGVVESAIREVTLIRLAQPSLDLIRVREKLEWLAASGKTPSIRVKAFLGSVVFENPEWFTQEGAAEYVTDDDVFGAILSRLRSKMLASG